MIEAKLIDEDGIVVVIPSDELQAADFERLRLLVDPYLQKHKKLNGLMIYVENFIEWEDFASLLSHIHFIDDHHKRIRRVAAVTDNAFLAILPHVSDYFVDAEVRHFKYADDKLAMQWLRSGELPAT